MKLSIISLNYKKPELTVSSMESLWKQYKDEFENDDFEYIVVDNSSKDSSFEKLQSEIKKYKNFHVFENETNTGFGGGNNFGVTKAKGEYLLFLNNDTEAEDKGILRMLEYIQEHNDIGILGGKMLNGNGTEQPSSGKFYTLTSVTLFLLGLQRYGVIDQNPKEIQEVDWVKGALLMIPKKLFEEVGKFDEHIFMYTEDMELCYRVKLHKLKCVFFPDIKILHKDQGSTNRTFAIVHIFKYLPYFYKKHKTKIEYLYVKMLLLTKAILLIVAGYILRKKYFVDTYSEALKAIE